MWKDIVRRLRPGYDPTRKESTGYFALMLVWMFSATITAIGAEEVWKTWLGYHLHHWREPVVLVFGMLVGTCVVRGLVALLADFAEIRERNKRDREKRERAKKQAETDAKWAAWNEERELQRWISRHTRHPEG
jgi:hypothetical protein